MDGRIIDVINGGSLWLLVVNGGGRIVESVVEVRFMSDIVMGEGLTSPYELVGRDIEVSEDGLSVERP